MARIAERVRSSRAALSAAPRSTAGSGDVDTLSMKELGHATP
jgi:hypothetical protein